MSVYKQKEIIVEKLKSMFVQNQDLQKAIYYPQMNYLEQPRIKNPYSLFENNPTLGADGKPILPRIYFSDRITSIVDKAGSFVMISMFESPMTNRINSMKLSIIFTVLVHNSCLITDYGNRFDLIFEEIDSKINGNYWLSDGFKVINKGTRILNVQQQFNVRNLIYETTITNTHNYGKFKESDKFDT